MAGVERGRRRDIPLQRSRPLRRGDRRPRRARHRARHPDRHRQAGPARQRALSPGRGRPQPAPAHLHRPHAGASRLSHEPGAALRRAAARRACSAATPTSPTSRRCAAAACRPTSRSPSSSCRRAPGPATPACSRATRASTTRRWQRTWSASAPTCFAQLVAPHPGRASRASASAPTPTSRSTCAPYMAARRRAGQPLALAVELNANLPYMPGEAEIDLSEGRRGAGGRAPPHYDLFAPPKEPVSLTDYAMALHAAALVKDGGTLQIGIGSFSDALAHALILRHTQERRVPRAARPSSARRCRRTPSWRRSRSASTAARRCWSTASWR